MAAPNIVNVTTILGKTAVVLIVVPADTVPLPGLPVAQDC